MTPDTCARSAQFYNFWGRSLVVAASALTGVSIAGGIGRDAVPLIVSFAFGGALCFVLADMKRCQLLSLLVLASMVDGGDE